MHFNALPEFEKDCKRLGKKYLSLADDLALFKKVLFEAPLGNDKHFAILVDTLDLKIAKARFSCRYLKKDSLRMIYAYNSSTATIIFIELYFKGDQEREDRERIRNFLNSL